MSDGLNSELQTASMLPLQDQAIVAENERSYVNVDGPATARYASPLPRAVLTCRASPALVNQLTTSTINGKISNEEGSVLG